MSKRNKFYFVSLNLLRKSHKQLIKWIKWNAEDKETSISSFCIGILMEAYKKDKGDGKWTDTE